MVGPEQRPQDWNPLSKIAVPDRERFYAYSHFAEHPESIRIWLETSSNTMYREGFELHSWQLYQRYELLHVIAVFRRRGNP